MRCDERHGPWTDDGPDGLHLISKLYERTSIQSPIRRVAKRLRPLSWFANTPLAGSGCQDDHRAPRPPHPSLRDRRDRARNLAHEKTWHGFQSQLRRPTAASLNITQRWACSAQGRHYWMPIGGYVWVPIVLKRGPLLAPSKSAASRRRPSDILRIGRSAGTSVRVEKTDRSSSADRCPGVAVRCWASCCARARRANVAARLPAPFWGDTGDGGSSGRRRYQ